MTTKCPINKMLCARCTGRCEKLEGAKQEDRDAVDPKVKKVCDDINHQLNNRGSFAWLEPYFQDDDWHGEWRVRIVDSNGEEICRHLQHDKLDWHTLTILLNARVDHGKDQHHKGAEHAVNKMAEHFKELVHK